MKQNVAQKVLLEMMPEMNLKKMIRAQREFVKAREWEQFHTPKNLVMALSVEASELLEIFQWFQGQQDQPANWSKATQTHVQEELADVLYYLVRLADILEIDLEEAFQNKMKKNARKYPVKWAKGKATKYSKLKKS